MQCLPTPVILSDASGLLKLLATEYRVVRKRISRNRRPKHWDNIQDLVAPFDCNLYGPPVAGLLWERRLQYICCKDDGRKQCFHHHRESQIAPVQRKFMI